MLVFWFILALLAADGGHGDGHGLPKFVKMEALGGTNTDQQIERGGECTTLQQRLT